MGRQNILAKRREWEDRLATQESSGLTVAEFCEGKACFWHTATAC